ncbi:hypothetical protein [Winogradskya humida]|uniref:Uncharacterized protein n=1 Tax=Winogradskya humida TaxID=113566 RepID=A0ABQ3ZQ11_9ACTN|nr:hypothetical protein [Actinoplanes humidus]GIE20671.1 hypothetical protein Ahu01nite_037730 [Actinoplanes humidus]
MTTLDDLHHMFDAYADQAPDGHGLIEQAREAAARRRVRRRWQSWIAALAVVAVTGGGIAVAAGLRHHDPVVVPPRAATQTTITMADGFTPVYQSSERDSQRLQWGVVSVTVAARPGYDTKTLTASEKLTINGHDAWYTGAVLGWQLPGGEWVSVNAGNRADKIAVAEQLRFTTPRDVLVPYRVGWLPPQMVAASTTTEQSGTIGVTWSWATRPTDNPGEDPVRIETEPLPDRIWSQQKTDLYRSVKPVGGHPAYVRDGTPELLVETPTCLVTVGTRRWGGTPDQMVDEATLRRIAENLTVADCTNRATWSPAG